MKFLVSKVNVKTINHHKMQLVDGIIKQKNTRNCECVQKTTRKFAQNVKK